MKNKIIFIALFIVILIGIGMFCFSNICGERPFMNLTNDEVVSINLIVRPPETTISITDEIQIKELVDILKTIVTYQKKDSSGYVGQLMQFNLYLKDGNTLEIGVYNPFIIINGTSYKTKYEPCKQLSVLGNKLIK
ncbi:hypothetical protein [Niameybacter massiliensis]|uniref:hypothetical protein n=1 Tax=Niameybacter massiliensis TaxID=1658108 RepID=UPI0006B4F897|nr:hypothetical protein [Niameybacter massiliensis]